jgi:hypothetical protein
MSRIFIPDAEFLPTAFELLHLPNFRECHLAYSLTVRDTNVRHRTAVHRSILSCWCMVILFLSFSLASPAQDSLQGASYPAQQFVTVAPDVKLEVLDWGGSGRNLVLLAGGGNTAHVYASLAPKLAKHFHVYGITRRGAGQSSAPPSGYTAKQFGDDVVAVLDALHLLKPVLDGLSGTDELTPGRFRDRRSNPTARAV